MKSKDKAISEKVGEFRKQEEFEDKKTLSKKGEKSLLDNCLGMCARKERLLLPRQSPETLPSQVSDDCEKNSFY